MATRADELNQARTAAEAGAWSEAYEPLRGLDGEGRLGVEELELLAEAAWWTGRMDEAIDARSRAFALRLEHDQPRTAALLALRIGRDHEHKRSGLASAWFARAERLLAEEPECLEQGYLERTRTRQALRAGELERAVAHAERTLELGTRFGDPNLMALGLHDKGTTLVRAGQVDEGLALLDEATVAAVSGELERHTTGIIYCGIIAACRDLADFGRAGDWTEAAKRWCERQAISGFPGICRVNRAEVMRLRGSWTDAEREIRVACAELDGWAPDVAAHAFNELGELQLRMGDLEAAEEAFREAHALGVDPQPGLALLKLARGDVEGARRALRRWLGEQTANRLARARVLPAQVEAAVMADASEEAHVAADELASIAEDYGTPAIQAAARAAAGAVALLDGDAERAGSELRRAVRLFQEVDTPYEAARTRLLAAEAYRLEGDDGAAELELRAAQATFERLGAAHDARRVAELLGRLPATATAERAARTFVFTDVASSTSLVEAIGDDAWQSLVGWHDRTLRALFAEHGGEEVDHAGDGFFVAFPDPAGAVACAVAVQRTLAEHRREHGFAPQVRIGVHAAEASRSGGGYSGKGVHEAARVGALAEGGEIVATRTTAELAGDVPASEPRSVRLKGIAEPVEIVTLDWR